MMGGKFVQQNWRKAAMLAGSAFEKDAQKGSGLARSMGRYRRGSKRLKYGMAGAGGLAVLNAARSPSSGTSGMMPQSSGGMTSY